MSGAAATTPPERRKRRRRHRRRKSRWSPVNLAVYGLARLGVLVLSLVPLRPALALARLVGSLIYRLDARHRAIARENLDHAYGDALSPEEKDRIIRGCYRSLTQNVVEMLHGIKMVRRGEEGPIVEVVGEENLEEARRAGRGTILLGGHMGNWELYPLGPRNLGLRVDSIATPRRNPRLEEYVIRMRESLGQKIHTKKGASRGMLRVLRDGGLVGVVGDQNTRKGGVFVDFFGRKAATNRGPATLSRRTGAPVVPTGFRRLPGANRHRITFGTFAAAPAWRFLELRHGLRKPDLPFLVSALSQISR